EFPEDSNFSPKASTSKLPTDASPDSKCPICLDRFDNVAYLDCCLHKFCFRCVQEWSKNKAECPLCKQPFFSIFHTIRAEDDFKEYVLSPLETSSFASPDGRRFRYRTTLTRERRRRSSPSRRMLSPPDNGMLFEGLSGEPTRHRHREIQQMIRRLASRRKASAEGRSLRQIQEEDMISFRRALYRTGVRIRSIQDGGRYREISAESIKEEKREDVKKQRPVQCHSWSDSERSRSFSPHSPTYREDVGSCRSCLSPAVEKMESKEDEKNKCKRKDLPPQDLSWSPSPGSDTVCSPWSHRASKKGKSRSPQSCSWDSRGSHGHRSRREHRSKSQLKRRCSRSRDSSKHRSKRRSRRSRAHDTRASLKSQRGSLSGESTPSREVSRSRLRSKGHNKRRSRSRDSDRYYVRDSYESRHQWGSAFCSRKVFGDSYESSSRRRTRSNTLYSRQSASPEYRIRSFIERTDLHSQRGLHERHYYCYERCRSRSRSSNRSRTPSGGTDRMKSEKPGGKRKYKTRHLENAFMESTSLERENDSKKTSSKFSDCCKNEDSLSDNRASSETKRKKRKKKIRSPSVEIVYEGKATDTTRHLKKKKKRHKKKHRKHHMSNSVHSSPVVITIDSDSSKEPEGTEWDSSVTWTGTTQINDRENESPSSFLRRTGCEETGGVDKKYGIPATRESLDDGVRNADVKLQETGGDQSVTTVNTSSNTSHTETVTSFVQEAPAAPSSQLPSPRTSFL
ncbi:TOPRS ligase, partial [Leptocoma aspasia]|nr:TOPRS ligase [Leptocoma aspasia]